MLISLLVIAAFGKDFYLSYKTEKQLLQIEVEQCKHEYEINRCDDPVPGVMELCAEKKLCVVKALGGGNVVGVQHMRIFLTMLGDSVNLIASKLNNRSLIVLSLVILTLYACKSMFGSVASEKPKK